MTPRLLGRTNREFPPVWLSLSPPVPGEGTTGADLAAYAAERQVPLDISSSPILWGGQLRGNDNVFLTQISSSDYEKASDDRHASDLIQAHLLETLSSIGREWIDIYFLRVRHAIDEAQLTGALEAMEMARQEGHIRFLGIYSEGPSLATLGTWQFHDAFDVLLVPRNHYNREPYETLSPLARERRVGIVTSHPLNWGYGLPFVAIPQLWKLRNLAKSTYEVDLAQAAVGDLAQDNPVIVGVRSIRQIDQALEAPGRPIPPGFSSFLEPYREAFDNPETWVELVQSEDPVIKAAVARRIREGELN